MRLIVAFDAVGAQTTMKVFRAPLAIVGMHVGRNVRISPPGDGSAKQRGEALAKLLHRHPPVKQAMDVTVSHLPAAPPAPIYFLVGSTAADALPWEVLFYGGEFLALDSRWPIGRVARDHITVTPRMYKPPFRVVAVLSAAGDDGNGTRQFETLFRNVTAARSPTFDVTLHIISGDEVVMNTVEETLAEHEGAADFLSAAWIENSPAAVVRQIAGAEPNILHILGHGGFAAPGVVGLNFATDLDFLAEAQRGSVVVSTTELAGALDKWPWLVVLAACKTAATDDDMTSPGAHDLVNAGIPAVIGMREIVDLSAMNAFCAAIYPELLSIVARALDGASSVDRVVEWSTALTAARKAALGVADAETSDEWAHPVLYVQLDELRFDVMAPRRVGERIGSAAGDIAPEPETETEAAERTGAPALNAETLTEARGRLDAFASILAGLDPATPVGVVDELRGEVAFLERLIAEATR